MSITNLAIYRKSVLCLFIFPDGQNFPGRVDKWAENWKIKTINIYRPASGYQYSPEEIEFAKKLLSAGQEVRILYQTTLEMAHGLCRLRKQTGYYVLRRTSVYGSYRIGRNGQIDYVRFLRSRGGAGGR